MFDLSYKYKKPTRLLTTDNAKTIKGEALGFTTMIIYMSPEKQNSQGKNICPKATEGCKAVCLFNAGRGKFSNVIKGRLNKTEYFLRDRKNFMEQLASEIEKGIKKYGADALCVRLNGTSDIPYENIPVAGYKNIMSMFSSIQFYDYTKIASRFKETLPKNYHLTFSMGETEKNKKECDKLLSKGYNVAAVFNVKDERLLPTEYKGYEVINADEHDLRFLDKKNVICGLKFKGSNSDMAKGVESGFVIQL